MEAVPSRSTVATTRQPTRIRSVSKAMAVLSHIADQEAAQPARHVAAALGLPIATAYHLLDTLVDEGMLSKDERRLYGLGPRVGALADAYHRQTAPPPRMLAALRAIAAETGETTYLSARRRDEVVLLYAIEGRHPVRVAGLHTGYGANLHARASGKVLMAFGGPDLLERYLERQPLPAMTPNTITDADTLRTELDRTRERGYGLDEEEFALGVTCVAAPIFDGGAAIAALTIAAPTGRFAEAAEGLVDAVRRAAAAAEGRS
jgi:IclR family acetate operon transcriptional repressor